MESGQKPKERVPLKEIQAKRRRARIVGKFCGYTSLVFFIDFMYFFFKLQLLGRLHGAAGYIVASLLVIAMAFHFGKVRAVIITKFWLTVVGANIVRPLKSVIPMGLLSYLQIINL